MRKLLIIITALLVAMASCNKESLDTEVRFGDPVTIHLDVPGTVRTPYVPDPDPDKRIETIRIMAYTSPSGKLVYNKMIDLTLPGVDTPLKLDVFTGTYDFVFIANEHHDPVLSLDLDTVSKVDKLSKLKKMKFLRSAFKSVKYSTPNTTLPSIPAMTHIQGVTIIDNDKIQLPGKPLINGGIWDVTVDKIGVKLAMYIHLPETIINDIINSGGKNYLFIGNIPKSAYIFPNNDNTDSLNTNFEKFEFGIGGGQPGTLVDHVEDVSIGVKYKRLLFPESNLTGGNNIFANGLKLEIRTNTKTYKATLKSTKYDYALPRNNPFDLKGEVKSSETYLVINKEDWVLSESKDSIWKTVSE